jgi:hypothetical protein
MCRLESGPLADWIAEDPDKWFGDLAEAWAEVVERTREVSPLMEDHELRVLRMVFYIGARTALGVLPESRNCSHFDVADAIRRDVEGLRACGGEPFAPVSTILRAGRRH